MKPKFEVGEIVEAQVFENFFCKCKVEKIYKKRFSFKKIYQLSSVGITGSTILFVRKEKDIKKLGERK